MNRKLESRATKQMAATAADWVARGAAGMTPEEERSLARWLAADPRHASAFGHHAEAFAAFDRPRATHQVSGLMREVELRVRRRRRRTMQTAAAGVLCLLIVAAAWRGRGGAITLVPPAENAIVHKPETRTLPDGSSVELKAGAEVTVSFSPQFRRVTLGQGTAHFQVARDSSRPFVVAAAGVETRAVGTAFSVQIEQHEVEVIVTQGRVAVERAEAAQPAAASAVPAPAIVEAGRRLVVNRGAGAAPAIATLPADELAERLAWRSPRLEFTDTPLSQAVALMNREARAGGSPPAIRLVVDAASKGLAAEPVSGRFRADKTEAFVRMLEITLGLEVEHRPGEMVLHRRR